MKDTTQSCTELIKVTQHQMWGGWNFQSARPSLHNDLRSHLTDLVARGSPLQQQSETVASLLVVLQALTQPTIIILHQPSVHNHFKMS